MTLARTGLQFGRRVLRGFTQYVFQANEAAGARRSR